MMLFQLVSWAGDILVYYNPKQLRVFARPIIMIRHGGIPVYVYIMKEAEMGARAIGGKRDSLTTTIGEKDPKRRIGNRRRGIRTKRKSMEEREEAKGASSRLNKLLDREKDGKIRNSGLHGKSPTNKSRVESLVPQVHAGIASEIGNDEFTPITTIEVPEPIEFRNGSSELDPASNDQLRAIALFMKNNPRHEVVRVKGHVHDSGDLHGDIRLSVDRARAARTGIRTHLVNYFVEDGMSRRDATKEADRRLKAEGYGPTEPLIENDSDEAIRANSRIEFEIL